MKSNKPVPAQKYYNIMTTEGLQEATIFLYGYIGEEYTWDEKEGWKMTGVTDIDFVKEFNELQAVYPVINIRINSYGGEVFHGAAIVNAILNAKSEVHGWCDGLCASMAAGIFLACKHRHMAKNGLLMIHSASNMCWGNARDLRECADALDQFDASLVSGMAAGTGVAEEVIKASYFDYADHWLTYQNALDAGFITETADYTAADTPTNLAGMKYSELVAHFKEQPHTPEQTNEGLSLLDRLARAFHGLTKPIQSPTNTIEMNFEEFKTAVADGKLDKTQVKAHLESLETPAPAEPAPVDNSEEIADLKATINSLAEKVKALAAQPGATRSEPTAPAGDLPTADGPTTAQAAYLNQVKAMNEAAAAGEPLKVTL